MLARFNKDCLICVLGIPDCPKSATGVGFLSVVVITDTVVVALIAFVLVMAVVIRGSVYIPSVIVLIFISVYLTCSVVSMKAILAIA